MPAYTVTAAIKCPPTLYQLTRDERNITEQHGPPADVFRV